MADSVKFEIIISKKIDDKELDKIKKEIKDELEDELKNKDKISVAKTQEEKFSTSVDKEEVKKQRKEEKPKVVSPSPVTPPKKSVSPLPATPPKKSVSPSPVTPPKKSVSFSPVAPPKESGRGGGIFGRVDPGVKGFQKRKGIRGGVERQRDDRSKAPYQAEKFNDQISRLEKQIKNNTVSSEAIEGIIKNHMSAFVKGSSVLSNPQEFVGTNILKTLGGAGPYGAFVVSAITAIVTAPAVAAEIIKLLSEKGLPLNRDWVRLIEDEVNGLFNVEEKKRRLLGIDSYIVTQTDRYQPDSGSSTSNSYENRDEIIISKFGQAERAVGII